MGEGASIGLWRYIFPSVLSNKDKVEWSVKVKPITISAGSAQRRDCEDLEGWPENEAATSDEL